MKTIRTATAAGAALLLAGMWTPAFASQASSTANAAGATQGAQNEQRICVREAVTGSRLERTVCRTRAEWRREGGVPGQER